METKRRKRKALAIAFIVICISLISYGTIAYFSAEYTVVNVITTGSIDLGLNEVTSDGKPFQDAFGVTPGDKVSKQVSITNSGKSDAYIRIKLSNSITLANGAVISGSEFDDVISLDINKSDWTFKDGWYYYAHPLAAGEETSKLFTEVTFSTDMGNKFKNSKTVIEVKGQAVQVRNNGTCALDAAGWPED